MEDSAAVVVSCHKRRRNWNTSLHTSTNDGQSSIRDFFTKPAPRVFAMSSSAGRNNKRKISQTSRYPAANNSSPKKTTKDTDEKSRCNDNATKNNNNGNSMESLTASLLSPTTAQTSTESPLHEEKDKGITESPKKRTTTRNNDNHNTRKTSKKMVQLFLDFGQKNFGKQTLCPICGMLYVHGVAEDAHEHEKICKDYRDGVTFQFQPQSCRIVAKFLGGGKEEGCIVEIRPSDSNALRQRAMRVMEIVDKELGFVQQSDSCGTSKTNGSNTQQTVFLYIRQKKIVGMVAAEIIQQAHRLVSLADSNKEEQDDEKQPHTKQKQPQQQSCCYYERSKESYRAMVGIHKLWVHSKARNKSLATRLMDTVRARMVYGTLVPPELVAFSSPTEAGARFAKSYLECRRKKKDLQQPLSKKTCGDLDGDDEEDVKAHVLVYDLPVLSL